MRDKSLRESRKRIEADVVQGSFESETVEKCADGIAWPECCSLLHEARRPHASTDRHSALVTSMDRATKVSRVPTSFATIEGSHSRSLARNKRPRELD